MSCLVLLLVGCSTFESARAPFEHELTHLTAPTSPSETIETAQGYLQGGEDIGESDRFLGGFMAASLFEKNSVKKASTQIQLPSSLEDPVRYESAGVAMELVMDGNQRYVSEVQDGVLHYQAEWGDETISYHYDRDEGVHKEWIVLSSPRSSFERSWELVDADQYTVTPTEKGGFAIQPLEYGEEFAFELLPAFYLDAQGDRHEESVLLTYRDGSFTLEISDLDEVSFPIAIDPSLVLPVGPPAVNAIDVANNQVITVEFDSAPTLVDSTTFVVFDRQGIVSGVIANPSGFTYTFTPSRDYVSGHEVQVILTAGTGLIPGYTWEFSVETSEGSFAYPAHTYDNPTPAAPTYSSGGSTPRSVDVADFNNDGNMDIAVVNQSSNHLAVLLGVGDGTFGAATTYAGSGSADRLAVADFDGDGLMDVVTNGNGDFDIYLNTGAGFSLSTVVTTSNSRAFDVGDIDADGDIDIVTDEITIVQTWDNDGSGNFSETATVNAFQTINSLSLADADADGDLDAYLLLSNGTVQIATNSGPGPTGLASSTSTVSGAQEIYVNDFNGDGYPDAVVGYYSLTRVYIVLNNGDGSLGSATIVNTFQRPTRLFGGDIDGDGDIDIIHDDADAAAWLALENDGAGNFTGNLFPDVWQYNSSGTTLDLSGADFNNDGLFDVIASGITTNNISVFLNTGRVTENVSGTCKQADNSTNCADGLTVRVAVDGVLAAETTTTSGGAWTISNVDLQTDSILTVFLDGVAEANEANAVTEYDGSGAITGVELIAERLTIGSDDDETVTSSDLKLYDNSVSGDEDIFFEIDGSDLLTTDFEGGHSNHAFHILSGDTYESGTFSVSSDIVTGDVVIDGTFSLQISDIELSGSWDNNGTFNGTSGSIRFRSSSAETIDSTGASSDDFGDVTFQFPGPFDLLTAFNADSITLENGATVTTSSDITLTNNGDIQCFSAGNCGTISQSAGTTTLSGGSDIDAGTAGNFTFASLVLTGSGTVVATGKISTILDLTVGNGSSARTFDLNTNDAKVTVGRDFLVNTNATLQASDTQSLSVGRDWTINGTFNNNSGKVIFNTTQTSTVNGSHVWQDLTVATPGKTILFESLLTQTVNGALVLVGAPGNLVTVDATVDTSQWVIDHQGTELVDYIAYEDTDCDAGSTTITVSRSTDNGNNGACFEAAVEVLSVSPSENALNIAVDSDITITFDQTMSSGKANQDNLPIYGSISGLIAGVYTLETSSVSNDTIRFNPTSDFIPGEVITISITSGVESNSGVPSMIYDSRFYAAVSVGSGVFVNRQDYVKAGTFSQLMSQGDLTNDGYIDLVIGSTGGLQVFINDGDGTFTAGVNLGGTQNDRQMDVADVNKDGNMDILAPNSSNVSVHLGNGDGSFQAVSNFAQQYPVKGVKAADMNGDGNLDLVASTFQTSIPGRGAVAVLLGDGAGNFQDEIETTTPLEGHYGAAVNDFNNDGKLDVVTGAYWDGVSYILLGVGDGTFQDPVSFTTSASPVFHGSAEWSGDGNADFAVSTNTLLMFFGDGAGGLTLNNSYGSVGIGQFATGDIDADGDLDLVTVDYSNAFGRVRLNNGSGTFGSTTSYATATIGAGAVTLGDYNNDGSLDFAITASQDTGVTVYHNSIQTDLSGTCLQNDGVTNCADGLTVRYALNGVLQAETTTTSGGTWTISSAASFGANDDIHVFLDGVAENQEAVGVTYYDGTGDITGFQLIGERLTIGSDDNTPISGETLGSFDNGVSGDEDIFFEVGASDALTVDHEGGHTVTLQVLAGSTFEADDITTHDVLIDGVLDATGTPTITVSGSWDNNSEFIEGTSRVVFTSTSTGETIGVSGATDGDFYDVEFNGVGGEWSPDGQLILNDLISVNGALEVGANGVQLYGGDLSCNTTCGTINQSNGQSFDLFANTVIGAGGSGGGTFRFGNLFLSSGGYTLTIDEDISAQRLTTGGNSNVVDLNTFDPEITLDNLTLSSSTTVQASDTSRLIVTAFQGFGGTFNANGGTIELRSVFSDTSNAVSFANVDKTTNSVLSVFNPLTVTGSLTISDGTVALNGQTLTMTGATFSNDGIMRLEGGESFVGFTQDIDSGTFEYRGDNGGGSLSIKDFGATDYYNLIINDTNGSPSSFQPAGNMVIANDLDVLAGTFQQTFDVTVNGANTFTLDGGTYTQGGNDLIVAGNMDIISGTFTGSSNSNVIDVGGGFTQSGGTFTSTDGNLEVAQDFTVSSGTFTNNSGAVVLDGTVQNITGDITFNDFTKSVSSADTLTVADDSTLQVDGALTLTGASGQLLTIRSNPDAGSTQWFINSQGTSTAQFLDLKDSGCDVGSNTIEVTDSTDSGNNDSCWQFPISVSGTCLQRDNTTNCANGQTVAVAVNGVLDGATTTTSGGAWTLSNVPVSSAGDVITVFLDGVGESNEAIAVAKYDGSGNITGVELIEENLTIGSDDSQTITNADIALYDNSVSGDEDLFMDVAASNDLSVDITTHDDVLRVLSGNTLRLDDGNSGNLIANDVVIEGSLRADENSIIVGGSWDNDSEFIADTSTVTFTSTTTETIDSTGSTDNDFNDLILFGSGGQWTLNSALIAADISVEVGTLLGAQDVTVTGGSFSCPTTCGTVNLTGGTTTLIGAGDLGDESLSGNGSFSLVNLTLEGAGTTVLGSALSLNGTLTIGDGTNAHVFDLNTRDQEVTANSDVVIASNSTLNASNSATFNARRDWTNDGTFTHNSGTVVFDPGPLAVTISGANTWFNFSSTIAGKTLQFENGVTQTVEGLLTLTGADGNLISVDSDSGGNQWLIDHQGTESVEYVSFQDTGCDALSTDITLTSTSVDNGNNGSCLLFDTDGDGIVDVSDNCPNDANAGQENNDGDGLGDVCDPDDDNDGVLDGSDSDPFDEFVCADSDSDTCDDCSVAGASQPANDGTDTDSDGLCNAGDPDDDGDGVADGSDGDPLDAFVCSDTDSDTCDDCSVSGSQAPSNDGPDNDTDGLCDAGDPDDDNDGFNDGADCQPNNASVNPGAAEVCNDAIDNDCDGDTDLDDSDCATFDTDGDGVPDVSDPAPGDNSVCGDSDSDTCDDCGVANTFAPANDGPDNESDGLCDAGDPDDDNDSVLDGADTDPFDEFVCEDSDSDTCDDCAVAGNAQPNNDGADNESDGLCDVGDPDDDNDGVLDGSDADPFDEFVCADSDSDTCDDCSVTGTSTPANDGTDTDTDGLCDAGDPDDDGDGFNDGADCQPLNAAVNPGESEVCNDAIDNDCDGDTDLADADCSAFDGDSDGVPDISDADPNDNFVCADSDSDSCDDCSVAGTSQPANDGTDTDTDGLCDAGDPDDDGDGVADGSDADPLDASVCSDTDSDSCDDCSVTNTQTPNNDGTDTDTDGLCDAGDPDDDGDGILDGADTDPLDPAICSDTDSDTCDDCSVTNTQTPNNDGLDTDTDGLCDAGDPDDDGDGEPDGSDCQPLNPAVNPSATEVCNDAVDNDCDGDTDLADADCATFDSDGDGVPDVTDTNPADEFICADNDADTCDDCSVSGFSDPGNDGTDTDSDGACDAGDGDDDNDGVPDGSDTAPLDNAICSDTDSDTCDDCSVTNSQTPNNDGLDTDTDGLCDAGDNDDDGDGFNDGGDCQPLNASINPGAVEICNDTFDNDCDGDVDLADSDCTGFDGDSDGIPDLSDPSPADPNVCGDADGDSCDDCSVAGTSQPANDGLDTDADGICNVGDNDDDGDGVNDGVDSNPLDPSQCSDLDSDGCNDCSVTNTQTPNNDGPDDDADGICNAGEGGGGLSRGRFDTASDRTNVFDQEEEEEITEDSETVAVEEPLRGAAPIEEASPLDAGDDSQQQEAQQQVPSGGSNVTRYYPYVLVEEEDEEAVELVEEAPVEPNVGLFVGIDFSVLMPPEEPEMETEPIFAPVASDPDVRELQQKVHDLRRVFQWMDPEGYELTSMNAALRDVNLKKQLVRDRILSIGESVDDSVNEYLPLVREPLDAPVSNIAELMKTLFISVDGICYTTEQLQRAFVHDTPDNGWWYGGYWYFMWELMIEYFGSQHLPWQDVGSIFFYGLFEDYVNDYCGRTDI